MKKIILNISIFSVLIFGFLIATTEHASAQVAQTCEYISGVIAPGAANASSEVTKLQTYLRTVEQLELPINGLYDEYTIEAVKFYQERYATEILAPWGLMNGTGVVGVTTKNKINDWYCGRDIPLSASELSAISSSRLTDRSYMADEGEIIGRSAEISGTTSKDIKHNPSAYEASLEGDQNTAVARTVLDYWMNKQVALVILIILLALVLVYLAYQLIRRGGAETEYEDSEDEDDSSKKS